MQISGWPSIQCFILTILGQNMVRVFCSLMHVLSCHKINLNQEEMTIAIAQICFGKVVNFKQFCAFVSHVFRERLKVENWNLKIQKVCDN